MENESVVIHIGYHKAASTYLQKRVFPKIPVNIALLTDYKGHILKLGESKEVFASQIRQWVHDEIHSQPHEKRHNITVISREELSGHAYGHKNIDPFFIADNLKRAFPKAKILIIIRNQFEYILSVYAYRVAIKGIEFRGLRTFLSEEGPLGLFDKLEYDRLIEYYMSLFGQEQVVVFPLEFLNRQSEYFFNKLAELMRVHHIPVKSNKKINASTRLAWVLRFWRPINFLFAGFLNVLERLHVPTNDYYYNIRFPFYRFREEITKRLNRKFKTWPPLSIPPDFDGGILFSRYARSNKRLEQLIRFDLKELGYPYNALIEKC